MPGTVGGRPCLRCSRKTTARAGSPQDRVKLLRELGALTAPGTDE